MKILGIETSCDETAAAVVEETGDQSRPWRIRANVVASQVPIHREWGGVVPELASRQHIRDICGVVEQALADADANWGELGAIAVTQGPGLVGSLLVGVSFAKSVAWSLGLPLVPVNHLAGHIESLVLQNGEMPLPAVVLVVSGGHTTLYHVERPGVYRLIGRTRDDAAGEAYDKVAKLVGLGYPGGPVIDRLAQQGDERAVDLPTPRMTHPDRLPRGPRVRLHEAMDRQVDFSFSGLKTAVLRHVRGRPHPLGPAEVADLCASFQRVVTDTLVDKLFAAAAWLDARSVGVAGGVSANSRLRARAAERGAHEGRPVFVPSLALATDNAAMIAAAGLRALAAGRTGSLDVNADASLPLHGTGARD
jgi:N6-L-threonylcarbamoyladenine synthase